MLIIQKKKIFFNMEIIQGLWL